MTAELDAADGTNETGLALSGGGFRATLFHLGAIRRLNEMAMLPEITQVSAVSGGSIIAGLMAARWSRFSFHNGVATNFDDEITEPIWSFCSRNIERMAVAFGLFTGVWKLAHSYRKHLVGSLTLGDLPDQPKFVFNATHIETGRNCTLSRDGLHTWRLGDIALPDLALSKAVAASSACPPWFPPLVLDMDPSAFVKTEEYTDLFHRDDLKRKVSLTDGGAYDNLGIHSIRNFPVVLVSDGSGPLKATHGKWFARQFNHRFMRPADALREQTRAIRRHEIVEQLRTRRKQGASWHISTDIRSYPVQSPLSIIPEWNVPLASIGTRLNAFTEAERSRLVNWGYVLCDLSVRSYYRKGAPPPTELPFPEFPFSDPPPAIRWD